MKTAFAIAALAIAFAGGHTHHATAHKSSVAVGVAEREWGISSYRAKVHTGKVRFNVTNFGEDAHNLEVLGPHGYRSRVSADIKAHQHTTLALLLRHPGVYRLICTKPGHVQKGMRASIRVTR
jgi:plastocyanin